MDKCNAVCHCHYKIVVARREEGKRKTWENKCQKRDLTAVVI